LQWPFIVLARVSAASSIARRRALRALARVRSPAALTL